MKKNIVYNTTTEDSFNGDKKAAFLLDELNMWNAPAPTLSKQITDLKELIPGKEYNIYCKQFDVMNKAVFICGDTTILKRDISYWQFSERGFKPINKQQLTIMFIKDEYPMNVFALYGRDLEHNIVTEIA